MLDSSLLRMSSVGLVAPQDPMWLSTLRAMDSELVSDSLVYRYDPGGEIGATGEQLGNFPQAFTHLPLIDAALTLNARLDQDASKDSADESFAAGCARNG